ncbi:MAG: hypothetical protein LC808_14765 [Actinobacteria bacterium]|nr:hypothetical protein [Acidobacteriota bacterium]MCA1704444.1 hypothetical protein [Actinomycetota bacterium]
MTATSLVAASLVLLIASWNLWNGFEGVSRPSLSRQRWYSLGILAAATFLLIIGPVAALTFHPLHGADLAESMALGAILVGLVAVCLATLHHVNRRL